MADPARAERLWLALAVATLWTVSVGSALEDGSAARGLDGMDLVPLLALLPPRQARRPRRLRLLRLGWLWVLVQMITTHQLPLPQGLVPDPWPDVPQRLEVLLPQQQALSYAPA